MTAKLTKRLGIACQYCGSAAGDVCRNGRGHATNPHDLRPYEESDPPETTMTTITKGICRRCGSTTPPLFHWKTDALDAGLLCKNCTTQAVLRAYGVVAMVAIPCP